MDRTDGSLCAGLVGAVGAVDDAALAVRWPAHAVAPGELLPLIVVARPRTRDRIRPRPPPPPVSEILII